MLRWVWFSGVIGSGLLGLVLASPAAADGKAHVDVSYSCLGVVDSVGDAGSPSAYVDDALDVSSGASTVFLDATAGADLTGGEVAAPTHSAATRVQANAISLQPFDVCSSEAESVLDAVVAGSHVSDPAASGVADVEFRFEFRATLETSGSDGSFAAYAGTELELLGVDLDSFEVSADGNLVQAPPGLSVVDKSPTRENRVYEISGTYVVEGQLLYGPDVKNVVKTTFYTGSEVANKLGSARIVRGFAAANAIRSVRYEIVSLDPNAVFTFVEAPAPSAPTAQ